MCERKNNNEDTGDYNKELKTHLKLVTSIEESRTFTLSLFIPLRYLHNFDNKQKTRFFLCTLYCVSAVFDVQGKSLPLIIRVESQI